MATAAKIATPPSSAVGRECQRSLLGLATAPTRRAKVRTAGVNVSDNPREAPTAIRLWLVIDIPDITRVSEVRAGPPD